MNCSISMPLAVHLCQNLRIRRREPDFASLNRLFRKMHLFINDNHSKVHMNPVAPKKQRLSPSETTPSIHIRKTHQENQASRSTCLFACTRRIIARFLVQAEILKKAASKL